MLLPCGHGLCEPCFRAQGGELNRPPGKELNRPPGNEASEEMETHLNEPLLERDPRDPTGVTSGFSSRMAMSSGGSPESVRLLSYLYLGFSLCSVFLGLCLVASMSEEDRQHPAWPVAFGCLYYGCIFGCAPSGEVDFKDILGRVLGPLTERLSGPPWPERREAVEV